MKRLSVFCLLLGVTWMSNVSAEDTGLAVTGELFTGSVDGDTALSAFGAVTIPLQSNFGLHVEALADKLDSDDSQNIGGHLYWRDANTGMLGIIASHTEFELGAIDGDFSAVGVEGELYLNSFSLAAAYAQLDSDQAVLDDEDYVALDVHWEASDAWYLRGGSRSLADEDIGYAEVNFIPDGGRSPFSIYGGATWNDFDSQYLGADYVVRSTASSSLSVFLEADTGEDGFDGIFLGITYTGGPVQNAPLISLFESQKGGF